MTVATTMEAALSKAINVKKASDPKTFLEREFPDGPGVKLVRVTVADAYELLTGDRNVDNRTISADKVAQYARDIVNDRWILTGETIKVSNDGLLNDGQHRLEAIIRADKAIESLVVYGVSRESRFAVDQGRTRGAGCYLAMEGIKNGNQVAALARMAIVYEATGGRAIKYAQAPTNAETRAYVHQHFAEIETAMATATKHTSLSRMFAGRTMFAFWSYVLRNHGPVAAEYLFKVQTGDQITIGDTVCRVRERLSAMTRQSRHAQTEVVLRGWTYYRDGKPWRSMNLSGDLPKLGKA